MAGIHNAMVGGEQGLVFRPSLNGQCGILFNENEIWNQGTRNLQQPVPRDSPRDLAACVHIPEAVSLIQRYSWMYYHFVEEALPRMALALPYLGPETKVLTWGNKYEVQWLALMNVTQDRIVRFDPEKVYCIDRLLFPTPTPKIEPPRESLVTLRTALKADPPLPPAARDLIIIVSRSDQETRRLSNENAMVAALKAAFPMEKFLIVKQSDTPAGLYTLEIFRRAKIILGPHGAGLSNMVFAAPGTTLIEIVFLHAMPLPFWHTAAALNQTYWMIPASGAFWMSPTMTVEVQDVVDTVTIALNGGKKPAGQCVPGYQPGAGNQCLVCDAGTYSTFGDVCRPCGAGRFASVAGSDACRTCPEGTVSDGTRCVACPAGTSSWPGSSQASQCLTANERRSLMALEAPLEKVLEKLSPTLLRRRQLAGAGAFDCQTLQSNSDLAGGDPYLEAYADYECTPRNGTATGESTGSAAPGVNLFPGSYPPVAPVSAGSSSAPPPTVAAEDGPPAEVPAGPVETPTPVGEAPAVEAPTANSPSSSVGAPAPATPAPSVAMPAPAPSAEMPAPVPAPAPAPSGSGSAPHHTSAAPSVSVAGVSLAIGFLLSLLV